MAKSTNHQSFSFVNTESRAGMDVSGNPDSRIAFKDFRSYQDSPKSFQPSLDCQSDTDNATVLVVDDDEMVLDVASQMLGVLGHDVLTANSGQKALSIYRRRFERIDVVLLDMMMPEMRGDVVFEKMKEINPDARVICASGYCPQALIDKMLALGCDAYFSKPLNLSELANKISSIPKKRKRRDAAF